MAFMGCESLSVDYILLLFFNSIGDADSDSALSGIFWSSVGLVASSFLVIGDLYCFLIFLPAAIRSKYFDGITTIATRLGKRSIDYT